MPAAKAAKHTSARTIPTIPLRSPISKLSEENILLMSFLLLVYHYSLFLYHLQEHKHELNRTGSLIEYPYFYDDLTGTENLLIQSRYMGYYDIKRIDEVLDKVDLTKDAKKKVINYSMGSINNSAK